MKILIFDPKHLLIYPNPTLDHATIHLNGNDSMSFISLWSIDGKLLKKIDHPDPKNYYFDLNNFKSGLYFINVETSLGVVTKMIEKMR